MKIVSLYSENVKRLKAVRVTPDEDGNVVIIGGNNGNGKTSLIDSIEMALRGKRAFPKVPVRQGEEVARIIADLGDLVVTRAIGTDGEHTVVVSEKDGTRRRSPQAILDKLYGTLSFDPLEFKMMEAAKQVETLRRLVGVNTGPLDGEYQGFYDRRTRENAKLRDLQGAAREIQPHELENPEPLDVSALTEELEAALETGRAADAADADVTLAMEKASSAKTRVSSAEERITELEAELQEARDDLSAAEATLDFANEEVATLNRRQEKVAAERIDPAPIRAQLEAADEHNEKVRENAEVVARDEKVTTQEEVVDQLNEWMKSNREARARMIAEAVMPVAGLAWDENGVTFNGLPFSQASEAEALRVSMAMGMALRPELRVLLIRDGSLLDGNSMKLVEEFCEAEDCQAWIERVGDGDPGAVIIEDGEVRADVVE